MFNKVKSNSVAKAELDNTFKIKEELVTKKNKAEQETSDIDNIINDKEDQDKQEEKKSDIADVNQLWKMCQSPYHCT